MFKSKLRRAAAVLLAAMLCVTGITTNAQEMQEPIMGKNLYAESDIGEIDGNESDTYIDNDGEFLDLNDSDKKESSDEESDIIVLDDDQAEGSVGENDKYFPVTDSREATAKLAEKWAAPATSYQLKPGGHGKYINGNEYGMFQPEKSMTRAEFSVMIYRLLTTKPDSAGNKFNDVPSGAWYAKEVNALANAGILNGYGNGTFKPNTGISRAETVSILTKFVSIISNGTSNFTDVTKNHWAHNQIVTAISEGWVKGYSDGSFKPNHMMKRCEAVSLLNNVLERHDANFAADRGNTSKEFFDVTSSHWAYLDIMEAGQRVANPIVTPPPSTETKYIKTITGVNFRKQPSTSSAIIATLQSGVTLTVIDASSHAPWIKAKHASYGEGYIHSDYVIYTDNNNTNTGDGVISTTTASIPQYKTLYLSGSVGGGAGAWTSDNSDIAVVFTKPGDRTKAFVYGKSTGTTNIRLRDSAGNIKSTCAVTVGASEAVRYAYSASGKATVSSAAKLVAITDNTKIAAKFVVQGPSGGSYETSEFTTETRAASASSTGVPQNSIKIFSSSVTINTAGSYTVRAYSKAANGTWSTAYKEFKLVVGKSGESIYTTTKEERTASNEIIKIIAAFEGKGSEPGEVYIDTAGTGTPPTVGYGYVVGKNTNFYNNLTETEMSALLSETINSGPYVKDLESFRASGNISMSQVQFDALVSFGYNLGTGYFNLNSSYDTFKILLNAMSTPTLPATATINNGTATLYNQAGTGASNGTIANGSAITVTEVKRVDGNVDNLWFKVNYGGKTGWIRGGHARFNTVTNRDLAYIDEQKFGSNLLEWNYAGGTRLPGLVYRRLAEAKIFCYGNYSDAYSSSGNYRTNVGFDAPTNVPGLALK